MSNTVIILRGPSGAGKTTLREKLWPEAKVCSADFYWLEKITDRNKHLPIVLHEGERKAYNFRPAELAKAHAWCMDMFIMALMNRHDPIVVDNTFIELWTVETYHLVAQLAGYVLKVHEVVPRLVETVKTMAQRNRHGVPAEIIYKMAVEFQPCRIAERHYVEDQLDPTIKRPE